MDSFSVKNGKIPNFYMILFSNSIPRNTGIKVLMPNTGIENKSVFWNLYPWQVKVWQVIFDNFVSDKFVSDKKIFDK